MVWSAALKWNGLALGSCIAAGALALALPGSGEIMSLWPPAGIALAFFLIAGPRVWPGVVAGELAVNLANGTPAPAALGAGVGSTAAALVVALALVRVAFDRSLTSLRSVLLWIASAAAAAALGATTGTLAFAAGGVLPFDRLPRAWADWWAADALGVLLFGSLVIAWSAMPRPAWRRVPRAEAALAGLGLLAACFAIYSIDDGATYLVFPLVIWIAVRFRTAGASAAGLVVGLVAAWAAFDHAGKPGPSFDGPTEAQAFAGVAEAAGLLLAALTSEWDRAVGRSRRSEDERDMARAAERQLAEAQRIARIGSWSVEPASGVFSCSSQLRRILRLDAGADVTVDDLLAMVHPDDRARVVRHAPALTGEGFAFTCRIIRADGGVRTLEVAGEGLGEPQRPPARVAGTARDVTEEHEANVARSRLAAVARSSPHAVVALELDGTIAAWNPAAEQIYGYAADDAVGRSMRLLELPGEDDIRRLIEIAATGGTVKEHTAARRHSSGASVDVATTYAPIRGDDGEVVGISVIARDLTDVKRAEAEAARLAHELDLVFNAVGDAIFRTDLDNRAIFVNDAACRMLGRARVEILGREMHALAHHHHPDGTPYPAEECEIGRAFRSGRELAGLRETFWRSDGSPLHAELSCRPVYEDGELVGSVVTFHDIGPQLAAEAERVEAEERLRRSEQGFRAAFETSLDAMLVIDDERRYVAANTAGCELLGVSLERLLTMHADDFMLPDDPAPDEFRAAGSGRMFRSLRRADGDVIEVEVSARADFVPGRHLAVMRDVTARRAAEREMERHRDLLERTERLSGTGSFEADLDGDEVRLSREACRILGIGAEPRPMTFETLSAFVHPDDRDLLAGAVGETAEQGSGALEYRIIHGDTGEIRWIHGIARRDLPRAGATRLTGTIQDITDRRRTERRLVETEHRYRELIDTANEGIMGVDPTGDIVLANRALAEMLAATPEALIGMNVADLSPDPEAARAEFAERREMSLRFETRLKRFDGTVVDTFMSVTPRYDADHNFIGGLAMLVDQSEAKQLQEQVHQMQKLETVGQLAGGIAHDFNNLLAVIINYAEFAAGELSDHPAREDVLEILTAAERAADLTQQLLLFSRKEMVRAEEVDLNDLVSGIDRLVHRAIGEDIIFESRLSPRVPAVLADRGQLEQVLLNLAINARDAMPDGGKLTIATSTHRVSEARSGGPLAPGRYARIAMSDTGSGMTPDVAERAFEPFFTTKPKGVGTGLGLATVYGIVTAAGGNVEIESHPGEGTTIVIDLPARSRAHSASDELPRLSDVPTVLVVEDEAAIRRLATRVLGDAGYRTIEADGPQHALELVAGFDGRIDAVLTDVVMPGMSGPALVERLAAWLPDARIVFMSGHIERSEKLPDGARLLRKPFRSAQLVAEVAAALETAVPR
jgi:two-component system cell cycle sensor histidine kinase/response regulator CckA